MTVTMEGKVYFFPVGKTCPCLQSHKVVNDCLNTNEWEALMGENAEADNSFLFTFTALLLLYRCTL